MRNHCVVVAFCLLALAARGWAQTAAELSIELIDQRLQTLQENGVADDDVRALGYQAARGFLVQRDEQIRQAAAFEATQATAAQLEADIQARLDGLDGSYDPTADIAGYTPEESTARLSLARAALSDANEALSSLDRRLAGRESSITNARVRIVDIDRQLNDLPDGFGGVSPASPPSASEAENWQNRARVEALLAERQALQALQRTSPIRFSLLTAQRAELALEIEQLSGLARELEASLTTAAPRERLALDIESSVPGFAVAEDVVENESAAWREQARTRAQLRGVRRQQEELVALNRLLEERFGAARRIVDFAREGDVLGQALMGYWEEIGDFEVADPTGWLSRQLGDAVIRRIALENELAELASATSYMNQQLQLVGLVPENVSPETRGELMGLVRSHRDALRAVVASLSEYIQALGNLEAQYQSFETRLSVYRDYLDDRVIWVANHRPIWTLDMPAIGRELSAFRADLARLQVSVDSRLVGLLLVAVLIWIFRIVRPGGEVGRNTVREVGVAALGALPLPLILLAVAGPLATSSAAHFQDLAQVLTRFAVLFFVVELLRLLTTGSGGVCRSHFGWPGAIARRLNADLRFMSFLWLPLILLAIACSQLSADSGEQALYRSLLLVAELVMILHLGRTLAVHARAEGGWLKSIESRVRAALLVLFAVLLLNVVFGQVYTVSVVTEALLSSLGLGVGLLLVYQVLERWLTIVSRRLRLKAAAQSSRTTVTDPESSEDVDEDIVDVDELSTETDQLLRVAMFVVAGVSLLYIWRPLLPAVDALAQISLWSTSSMIDGELITNQITLATLLTVAGLVLVTVFTAQRLPAVVEIILRNREVFTPGTRYTISTLLGYLIVGSGIVFGLAALGLRWSQLQWLIAALGVGIGFGLQEIVANFISGLIILFERPIRVGDVVSIGDVDGKITKIRIRATTLRGFDGKELLVPNKEFITGRLLNWTLSDPQIRVDIPVGIAYGSDVEKALELLREVVTAHPRTLDEPAPLILFVDFGDNALQLSARCFLDSTEGRFVILTELRTAINKAFAEAGIVIAFPQRDVHLDSDGPLRIALEPS